MCKKIFLFLCFLFWAKGGFALSAAQHMAVQIGIFDAAEVDLFYTFGETDFDIKADVVTTNVFDTLYPFRANYEAKGQLIKGDVLPSIYTVYSKTRKHVRTKQIFYDDEGKAYKRISAKDKRVKEMKITGVPPTANAADLQSVFATFILFYKENRSCKMVREVYDGKKHYKIFGEDKGQELRFVPFLQSQIRTQACHIYLKNLKDNEDALLDASADRPIKLWLASDGKTEFPFVVEIGIDSTPLGALKVTPITLDIH